METLETPWCLFPLSLRPVLSSRRNDMVVWAIVWKITSAVVLRSVKSSHWLSSAVLLCGDDVGHRMQSGAALLCFVGAPHFAPHSPLCPTRMMVGR